MNYETHPTPRAGDHFAGPTPESVEKLQAEVFAEHKHSLAPHEPSPIVLPGSPEARIAELEKQVEEQERVIMATRQLSIEAMNRIRELVGAKPEDPLRAEDYVRKVVEERDRYKAIAAEGRRAGREEALAILLEQSAEDFGDKVMEDYSIGDTGEYGVRWVESAMRELLDVETPGQMASELDRLEGFYWQHAFEIWCLKEAAAKADLQLTHWKKLHDSAVKTASESSAKAAQLTKENDAIKAILARLEIPCIYCGLDDMSKCTRGFPGCAKGDDILCGEEEHMRHMLDQMRLTQRNSARLATLRKLMGYVQDGSHQTVTLFEDDATRDVFVRAGKQEFYASCLFGALDKAAEYLKARDQA